MGPAVQSIADLRHHLGRVSGVGLVPTMGALHQGHARLIEQARAECKMVVVTIFVNPLQFDRDDDLQRYPRSLDRDLELCAALGVDYVFAPEVTELYPRPQICRIDVGALADHLCGPFRPGHFGGVATVVLKLFEIVRPDRAYFGEKDAQQLAIIRRLVAEFNVPIAVVGVPTVREEDGLALSSRNLHLSAAERQVAPVLYRALLDAQRQVAAGGSSPEAIANGARARIPAGEDVRLEYLQVVDPQSLQPVVHIAAPVLIAGAMWVGRTRLIDNVMAHPPGTEAGRT